jgi:hypothetical protein
MITDITGATRHDTPRPFILCMTRSGKFYAIPPKDIHESLGHLDWLVIARIEKGERTRLDCGCKPSQMCSRHKSLVGAFSLTMNPV